MLAFNTALLAALFGCSTVTDPVADMETLDFQEVPDDSSTLSVSGDPAAANISPDLDEANDADDPSCAGFQKCTSLPGDSSLADEAAFADSQIHAGTPAPASASSASDTSISPNSQTAQDSQPASTLSEAAKIQAPPSIPWKTETYSLVARSMSLRQVIETFTAAEGIASVLSDSISGIISGDFSDIPCAEFLDRLCALHNLSWYWDGATLWLYGAGEMQTILLDLRYMKAGEVRAMLAELGVEDPRFPLKTASEDELIMVSGPPRYVALVSEMIQKADSLREKRTFNEIETRIFPLENTWAEDVSFSASSPESGGSIKGMVSILKSILTPFAKDDTRESGSTNAPSSFTPVISAENRLNAVVVTDVATRMPLYERLIRQFDVPQKLVEISVTVVELTRNDSLDWQLSLAGDLSRGRTSGAAGQNAGNLFGIDGIDGRGLAGALTRIGSHVNISASLTALRDAEKARSVSRTALLTVDNIAVELSDTQTYHARVVGSEVASLESVSAGTNLKVKPRIMRSATNDIPARLWLTISLSDGGFQSVVVDSMPMSRSSNLDTQTSIEEGETLMLAGYLRDVDEDARWGIPLLRDIPLIGWLFGGYTTKTETVQRLFLISPRIVDITAEDLARIQASNLRDIEYTLSIKDDAEEDAAEREIRDNNREARLERRKTILDARLRESEAALEKARADRVNARKAAKAAAKNTVGAGD